MIYAPATSLASEPLKSTTVGKPALPRPSEWPETINQIAVVLFCTFMKSAAGPRLFIASSEIYQRPPRIAGLDWFARPAQLSIEAGDAFDPGDSSVEPGRSGSGSRTGSIDEGQFNPSRRAPPFLDFQHDRRRLHVTFGGFLVKHLLQRIEPVEIEPDRRQPQPVVDCG
jgi:hypothetical protein